MNSPHQFLRVCLKSFSSSRSRSSVEVDLGENSTLTAIFISFKVKGRVAASIIDKTFRVLCSSFDLLRIFS